MDQTDEFAASLLIVRQAAWQKEAGTPYSILAVNA